MKYQKTLKVGQTFEVTLNNMATTGYTWNRKDKEDSIIQVSQKTLHTSTAPGASGKLKITVKALQPGHAVIHFIQARQWEPNDPIDECIISIDVIK